MVIDPRALDIIKNLKRGRAIDDKNARLCTGCTKCALCVVCLLYHWQDATDKVSRILCKVQGSLTVIVAAGIAVALFFLHPLALWACVILVAALIGIATYVLASTIYNRPIGMVCGVALNLPRGQAPHVSFGSLAYLMDST